MLKASFTRDEVILALDVLYSSEKNTGYVEPDKMQELSLLLRRLPIHSVQDDDLSFRCASGIQGQLRLMKKSLESGIKSKDVGQLFIDIAEEFRDRHDDLHLVAAAIRRNEATFVSLFGSPLEDIGFSEGILLGHLHRLIEQRDGTKTDVKNRCEVCNIQPKLCYHNSGQLLQNHLVVAPTLMDYSKKYRADSFLTVCPTCHAALHRYRPWLTKENCGDILS